MAALLDRIHLHRHALPDFIAADLDHEVHRRALRSATSKPMLVATWHIGPVGHPVCIWSVTKATPVSFGLARPSG